MLAMADLDQAFGAPPSTPTTYAPHCQPPTCFVASYPPVTPAGHTGPFFVNTYFLRPDRIRELGGPVPIRSNDIKNKGQC